MVGEIFKAGAPIQDFAFKTADAVSDYLNDAPNKRSVKMNDFLGAVEAIPKTIAAYKGAKTGIQSKMGEYQQRFATPMTA